MCVVRTFCAKFTHRMRFDFRLAAQFAGGTRYADDYHNDCLCAINAKAELAKPALFAVMSDEMNTPPSGNDWQNDASPHRESQAEPEAGLKRKWIESDKAAPEIGFERALKDWIIERRHKWRENRSR